MTLAKRNVSFAANYIHPEFMDRAALDTTKASPMSDSNMAEITGVLSQIGHLAAYTMELLEGLYRISQETQGRIEAAADRTVRIQDSLEKLEKQQAKQVRVANAQRSEPVLILSDPYPLLCSHCVLADPFSPPSQPTEQLVDLDVYSSSVRKVEIKVPHIFTRITNDDSVLAQYYLCTPPPGLYKIDLVLTGDQCSQQYSNPRFFFEQWYKSELKRQEEKKAEKKAKKDEKRKLKEEKKKTNDKKTTRKAKRTTMQNWKTQVREK